MIDFLKFGFSISEVDGKKCDDLDAVEYENDLLTIQHWRKPDVCIIGIRRDRFLVYKTKDELSVEIDRTKKSPTTVYKIKEGIGGDERRMAEMLLSGGLWTFPLFVGEVKDETFFEILLSAICTDAGKIIQCGS